MASAVQATGVPGVELRATRLGHDLPFVGVDNHAIGQMVAEHFLDRGFRHFGVYTLNTETFFAERCDNFVESLRVAGHICDVHSSGLRAEKPSRWEKQQNELADWVSGLPKPVGLMACTDQMGYWLLDACKRVGIAVPEEAAIVGVEDDESLCAMAIPPLSSVQFNSELIGYEAASLLDRLMCGEASPEGPTLIAPPGIVTRQSSDIVAVDHPQIAEALQFIRENACKGISVEDILAAVAISQSALERHMGEAIGRTPKLEINRVRLKQAKQLLRETDLKLEVVARKSGYKHPQYFSEVFKKKFGITPGEFRRSSQVTGRL